MASFRQKNMLGSVRELQCLFFFIQNFKRNLKRSFFYFDNLYKNEIKQLKVQKPG